MDYKRLARIRKAKGFTQKDIAIRLGIDQSTLSKIESNAINLDIDTAIKLAKVYDVTLYYLIGYKEPNRLTTLLYEVDELSDTKRSDLLKVIIAYLEQKE